jgi:hypothetical protein
MSIDGGEGRIREALSTVGQYLSDSIAPLQVSDSVAMLLGQPAERMASEIIGWVPAPSQENSADASVADYLYHAVSKLQYLAQLQLISEQALSPYLDSLKQLMLEYCPPEDRQLLRESFGRLGMAEPDLRAPVSLIHRLTRSVESAAEHSPRLKSRRLSILGDRLKAEVQRPASTAAHEAREDMVPQLIATAAANLQSDEEYHRLQENLSSLGIEAGTDKIFRKLSDSLPGWLIATTGTDAVKSNNAAVEAMSQIIHLSQDRWEGFRRFQDMVQTAIEQFNTGSLARAATMFDLALGICSDGKLDANSVGDVRSTSHESLNMNRLRNLAKDHDKYHLLRGILNFFDEFAVGRLLDSLQGEEKRERRRLLLDLLEAHGDEARKAAYDRLKDLLADTNVAADWHFARNLVCILTRIPRASEASLKAEIQLISPLLQLSLPAPLVKEAIKFAGQAKCAEAEELLIATADKLVRFAVESSASDKDAIHRVSLLDRAIFALAQYGTPRAYARVVKHGTNPLEGLGDTVARLSYLSSQDLASDKESVAELIQFLKSRMPRKLFGMTIQKNEIPLLHVIKALSSTPTPIVRQTFMDIAAQFPETKFGQAAANALREFGSSDKVGLPAGRMLTGDLDLFGLPDLLRQLIQLQATGALTLKDARGNPAGNLTLLAGRMQNCRTGRLEGTDAAYQLLERPMPGTFVFQGKRNFNLPGQSDESHLPDLASILTEGIRRYDQLQRARAIVPDFALLRQKDPRSVPPGGDADAALSALIWKKLEAGASPEDCEAMGRTDSYSIRTLLARWNEEGFLIVE